MCLFVCVHVCVRVCLGYANAETTSKTRAFVAHKTLLTSNSPMLEAMFTRMCVYECLYARERGGGGGGGGGFFCFL